MAIAKVPPPTFDLETWASNYTGPLLPLRLSHVAVLCPSLTEQALSLAISSAKSGKDVQLYERTIDLAAALGKSQLAEKDEEWVKRTEDANRHELVRLEGELKGYKNNLIRESIRMGQEDLATHQLLTGGPRPQLEPEGEDATHQPPQPQTSFGLNAAYAAFGKMRDHCTTPTHVASMTLRLTFTAILQAVTTQQTGGSVMTNYNAVLAQANRLRNVGVKEEEQAKLQPLAGACAGIAYLGMGNYKAAAEALLKVPFDYTSLGAVHGMDFSKQVASANDIAIYGGLTALATATRQELIDNVLGGPFRAFLELEPHMRKAISLFTTAKYRACLDTLQRYYSDWRLDVFLGAESPLSHASDTSPSHVDVLFACIREKSITSYLFSFSEVSISSLAATFPPPASSRRSPQQAMEDEVLRLIEQGYLPSRLDLVNGTIVTPGMDARTATHKKAVEAADEVERTLLLRLHKVNVALAGLEVPKAKGGVWNQGMMESGGY